MYHTLTILATALSPTLMARFSVIGSYWWQGLVWWEVSDGKVQCDRKLWHTVCEKVFALSMVTIAIFFGDQWAIGNNHGLMQLSNIGQRWTTQYNYHNLTDQESELGKLLVGNFFFISEQYFCMDMFTLNMTEFVIHNSCYFNLKISIRKCTNNTQTFIIGSYRTDLNTCSTIKRIDYLHEVEWAEALL